MKLCELSAAWRSHHNPVSPWEHGYKDAHAIDLDAALAPVVALAEEWLEWPDCYICRHAAGLTCSEAQATTHRAKRRCANELLAALGKKVSDE